MASRRQSAVLESSDDSRHPGLFRSCGAHVCESHFPRLQQIQERGVLPPERGQGPAGEEAEDEEDEHEHGDAQQLQRELALLILPLARQEHAHKGAAARQPRRRRRPREPLPVPGLSGWGPGDRARLRHPFSALGLPGGRALCLRSRTPLDPLASAP